MIRYGFMHPGGFGLFGLGFGWIFNLIFWVFLVIMVVVFIKMAGNREEENDSEGKGRGLEILKERYAKGEITKKEFLEMKKDIS